MKTRIAIGAGVLLIFIAPLANRTFGVEGGLARPISGAAIMPYVGLVPPLPGIAVAVGEAYYTGTIGGATTVPVGNNLTLGVDMKASLTPIALLYIYGPRPGKNGILPRLFLFRWLTSKPKPLSPSAVSPGE